MAKEITDANFNAEVCESDKLTLVDFWAEWCGPCRKLAPMLDEVEKEYNEVCEKLTKAQLALDNINTSIEFELDI